MAKAKTQKKANPSSSALPAKQTKGPGPKLSGQGSNGPKEAVREGAAGRSKAGNDLLESIQDLGGDAEDFALVNGVDEDEEGEDVFGEEEEVVDVSAATLRQALAWEGRR